MITLNRLERMLIAIAMLAIAAAWLFTLWNIAEDRAITRSSSLRIVDSLAASLEEHLGVTLRDARNAVYSAAVLIENSGGFGTNLPSLHRELNRELHDTVSTARLIAADAGGHVIASSSEYPLPALPVAQHASFAWHASHPAEQGFHLGVPYKSAIDGKPVIPYSRAVFGKGGGVSGVIVAELRVGYLADLYTALTSSIHASIVVFNHDGIILMRVPYEERRLGQPATAPETVKTMLRASGQTEFTSAWDGKTRYYSHRVMRRDPILIAVGVERDEIMAPSAIRTGHRLAVIGAATLVFVALVWLLMVELRRLARSEARLRAISQRLMNVQEAERHKLNRELHDRVGQNLSALQLDLGALRSQLADGSRENSGARLDDAQALLEATSRQVRDVMGELRPTALDDFGLLAALRDHAAAVSARIGVPIAVRGREPEPRLPHAIEIALFRIVQEALNNVAKHARARKVEVELAAGGNVLNLSITDDGVGFDARRPPKRVAHYGLATMRERADAMGAKLRIEAAPGRGTRVQVDVAISPAAAA